MSLQYIPATRFSTYLGPGCGLIVISFNVLAVMCLFIDLKGMAILLKPDALSTYASIYGLILITFV